MRYVILHTPRTGSNVLCDCLVQTGLAGMRDLNDAGFFIGFGETVAQAFASGAVDKYFERNRTPNGIEGCKLGWDYIEHLNHFLTWGDVDKILRKFDRFIWLTREDVAEQAVSRLYARTSGVWTSLDKAKGQVLPVHYNVDRLSYFVAQAAGANAAIETWLRMHRQEALHLTYEDNVASWDHAVARVLRFVGYEGEIPSVKPKLRKLADSEKARWANRFREEVGL
jgi:LPS sulfotransferase NodH